MISPTGTCPAKIMIIGEAPSREDMNRGRGFSGAVGYELEKLLQSQGLSLSQCFATHATKDYPPRGNPAWLIPQKKKDITAEHVKYRDRFVHPSIPQSIKLLMQEIELCQPNIILALGNVAMWVLTGKFGIGDWRGSELVTDLPLSRQFKVIPTYAPDALFSQQSLKMVVEQDLRRLMRESQTPEIVRSDYTIIIPSNISEAMEYLTLLELRLDREEVKLACDIETRMFHMACIGIAISKNEAFVLPIMKVSGDKNYWSAQEEAILQRAYHRILTHKNARVVGQNFIFDAQHIHRSWHFIPRFVRDTMLAQHVCFPGMLKGLDFISSFYCEHYTFWKNDSKEWAPSLGERQLWLYNGEDCCRTYECDTVLQQVVGDLNLRAPHDFQQSLFYPVLRTMIRGVRVDAERQARLISELKQARVETQEWLNKILGYPLNVNSPKQVATLFYEDLAQKAIINRKTNTVTANEEALRKLVERQPLLTPIVNKILELRSIGIFLSTFLGEGKGQYHTGLLDKDGRLRCSYNIGGTKTFRFASDHNAFGTGMNFQNIPKGDEDA